MANGRRDRVGLHSAGGGIFCRVARMTAPTFDRFNKEMGVSITILQSLVIGTTLIFQFDVLVFIILKFDGPLCVLLFPSES